MFEVTLNEDVLLILIWTAILAVVFCLAALFSDWADRRDRLRSNERHMHLYKKVPRETPTRRRYDVKPARTQQ